ncbi:MAG: hypothetical protein K1Y02_12845 [Candidatus Hydrogenedentes bacterium]|nr:hypothetical protein [Candidatus Hydrogenedentota bacterium]
MNRAGQSLNAVALDAKANLERVLQTLQKIDAHSMADHVPSLDLELRAIFDALDECARFCEVHRPPVPCDYDPVRMVRDEMGHFVRSEDSLAPDEPELFWGDPEQLRLCLSLIVRAFTKHRIAFSVRLYLDASEPRIEIAFDQAIPLPISFALGERLTLTGDEFGHFWTAATDGGEVRLREDSFALFFVGDRTRATLQVIPESVRSDLARAAQRLSAWKGAIGQYEEGLVSPADARRLYERNTTDALDLLNTALAALQ